MVSVKQPSVREQRLETTYRMVNGQVQIILELQVKDIDSGNFIVAGRTINDTGKTKEKLRSDIKEVRDRIVASQQLELNKLNALEIEVPEGPVR